MIATVPGTLPHVASRVAVTMPFGAAKGRRRGKPRQGRWWAAGGLSRSSAGRGGAVSFRRAQTRTASLLEAGTNVLVGYLVALLAQQLVFPLFGIHTTLAQDSAIAAAFTAVSLARSYLLRRVFERLGSRRGARQVVQPGRTYRLVEDA